MSYLVIVFVVAMLSATRAAAQQLLWQIPTPPSVDSYEELMPFGDYDGDGHRDLLAAVVLNDLVPGPQTMGAARVLSGSTGAILAQHPDFQMQTPITHGGDMDGDGYPDVIERYGPFFWGVQWGMAMRVWSLKRESPIWEQVGPWAEGFGEVILGGLDVTGDDRPDVVTVTAASFASAVYVYDNAGTLLYTVPCSASGRVAISLAKMGDLDGDHCDDFVVGCREPSSRGVLVLVSGQSGTILRESFGLLPGDRIEDHVSNMGDMDGDGVNDYAGFPWWSATRAIITVFSGQTGAVIRTWDAFANSAVTGQDVDLDGVPDLVIGSDYPVSPPQVYGRTRAFSGRDGTELWRVDNFSAPPGSGFWNGSTGWMDGSGGLGVLPGSPYPCVAWFDQAWTATGSAQGRVRAYNPARAGQGPVTGTACTSQGTLPQIGARTTSTGSRVTIAKSHRNALGALWLSLNPLASPVDLSPLGAAACTLYVNPDATFLRTLGTTGIDRGYAAVDLPFQLAPAGLGLGVVAQWLVLDPLTHAYAATQMHALRLQ